MITTDFISTDGDGSSGTGFNLRFATTLSSGRSWLGPIFGVNVVPYGTTGFSATSTNAPSVFIGNVFTVITEKKVGGWLRVEMPVLWYYTYDGGGPRNERLFGRDFYLELALTTPLGAKLFRDLGPTWSRVEAYMLMDQNLTPNRDRVTGKTDRFNPIAMYGLSLSFGR